MKDVDSMIFFNWRGIVGFSIGCAVAWVSVAFLPIATGYQICYGALIAVFASSLFAFATDRCDRSGLWQSYRVNSITFYYPALGQPIPEEVGINPERRLAVLMWPLAFGPVLLCLTELVFWPVDWIQETHVVNANDLVWYTLVSFFSAAAALTFGRFTTGMRAIQRAEVEPHHSDGFIEVRPTTIVGRVAVLARGGSTANRPSRRPALVATTFGVIGLAYNHFGAEVEHQITFLAVVVCPVLVLMGIGGLIDPRITWSTRAEGRHYPFAVRAAGALLLILSFSVSVTLYLYVYHERF